MAAKDGSKESQALPPGAAADTPKKKSRAKRIVIFLAILLITLSAAGGAAYWWLFLRSPDGATPESPAVQTASGTYTGAGTYGSNSRNSLTFNFEPELLIVAAASYTSPGMETSGYYGGNIPYLVWTGQPGSAAESGYGGTAHNVVSVSGQTIRWYSVDAASQLNARNTTYYYFAAGRTGA